MDKKAVSLAGLGLALVLFAGVNLFCRAALRGARWDLTENGLYTLAEGSRRIAAGLAEPIRLRFYYSEDLAGEASHGDRLYGERVRELLEEFAAAAGGRIVLEVVEPEPYSEEEEEAVQYGLQGRPVNQAGDQFFFGLVGINATDDREVIPYFSPRNEDSLEYDVAKLIYTLGNPKKKVVGLISSLPLEGSPPTPFGNPEGAEPWSIVRFLREMFEVRPLGTQVKEIPADVDVLLLVHPKSLSAETLYAVDQYVLKGGRLLAFVDPLCEADVPMRDPSNPFAGMSEPKGSDLQQLFDAWGVELVDGKVLADRAAAVPVRSRGSRGEQVVPYVLYLRLGEDNLNREDFVTADLSDVMLASPGILRPREGAAVEIVPLIQSSAEASQVDEMSVRFMPDPRGLLERYVPEGQFTLAARLRGQFKTAFPGGPPKEAAEQKDEQKAEQQDERKDEEKVAEGEEPGAGEEGAGATAPSGLQESQAPANIIVVADVDLLHDRFWVQLQDFFGTQIATMTSQNATFLFNALDNLCGSNDLIGIRSRREFERPFERVRELEVEAQQRFQVAAADFERQLRDTESKLRSLQFGKEEGTGALVLSAEQKAEIQKLEREQVRLHRELRNVQLNLNRDIRRLGTRVKLLNIGLVPVLIGVLAAGLAVVRAERRKKRRT